MRTTSSKLTRSALDAAQASNTSVHILPQSGREYVVTYAKPGDWRGAFCVHDLGSCAQPYQCDTLADIREWVKFCEACHSERDAESVGSDEPATQAAPVRVSDSTLALEDRQHQHAMAALPVPAVHEYERGTQAEHYAMQVYTGLSRVAGAYDYVSANAQAGYELQAERDA